MIQEAQWHPEMTEDVFQVKKSQFLKLREKVIWFFLVAQKEKKKT